MHRKYRAYSNRLGWENRRQINERSTPQQKNWLFFSYSCAYANSIRFRCILAPYNRIGNKTQSYLSHYTCVIYQTHSANKVHDYRTKRRRKKINEKWLFLYSFGWLLRMEEWTKGQYSMVESIMQTFAVIISNGSFVFIAHFDLRAQLTCIWNVISIYP